MTPEQPHKRAEDITKEEVKEHCLKCKFGLLKYGDHVFCTHWQHPGEVGGCGREHMLYCTLFDDSLPAMKEIITHVRLKGAK